MERAATASTLLVQEHKSVLGAAGRLLQPGSAELFANRRIALCRSIVGYYAVRQQAAARRLCTAGVPAEPSLKFKNCQNPAFAAQTHSRCSRARTGVVPRSITM
eukprot:1750367-Rhodomonas_salina.1